MSAFRTQITSFIRATLTVALCFFAAACVDRAAQTRAQSLAFMSDWFTQANNGVRDDTLCHGLGLLKHQAVSCQQMLSHAAGIDPASRQVEAVEEHECFAEVCGDFVEIRFNSRDLAGNKVRETALLKRDDDRLRLYWYRSDSLLEVLRAARPGPQADDDMDPDQLAYDKLTARYPRLYVYPRCYEIRVSSTNLAGKLMAKDALAIVEIEHLADACGERFCLAFIGNKIAPVCPK